MPTSKQSGMGTRNYYTLLPKKYLPATIEYKNKKIMNINLPARIGIIGASGSCKTNWLLNFIECVDSFDRVTIYAKNTQEPLYQYLMSCLDDSRIAYEVFDDLTAVIPCSEYEARDNNLVIFDDFQNSSAKDLKPVNDIFTMGRKNGITAVYIAQSYFKGIPSIIRANLNYLVILKISTKNDLARVISDNSLDVEPDTLMALLKHIRSLGKTHFMLLDKDTIDSDLKYRIDYEKTCIS